MKATAEKIDRSALANHRTRRWNRGPRVENWIAMVEKEASQCSKLVDDGLIERTQSWRHEEVRKTPKTLAVVAGCVVEAVRRTTGWNMYGAQVHAGLAMCHGMVCEMQTGEGKTLAMAIPAAVHALSGYGVHLSTPNPYLATRDEALLRPAFELLGLRSTTIGIPPASSNQRQDYGADIVYGPGYAFGFDFLRDQWNAGRLLAGDRGHLTRRRFNTRQVRPGMLQRSLYAAIVDEIDHVLLDDAVSPLVLSESSATEAEDADAYREAADFAVRLTAGEHFQVDGLRTIKLTESGFQTIYDHRPGRITQQTRPWHDYVRLALHARHVLHRDVDYLLHQGAVCLIDPSTGRLHADRTWSDGLHPSVEAKEGLLIRDTGRNLASITRQRFFRLYRHLCGATGTASGCEKEFGRLYGVAIESVPPRLPSKREVWTPHFTRTQTSKRAAITQEAVELADQGRAVLIGTPDIASSNQMVHALHLSGRSCVKLDGTQDADEANLVAQAGRSGSITVATQVAGRGTDIPLDTTTRSKGGLHVIVMQPNSIARVDRQLIGRAARGGDPGSCRTFLSTDDPMVQQRAPWIARSLTRWLDEHPEGSADESFAHLILSEINKVQTQTERAASLTRWNLFHQDQQSRDRFRRSFQAPLRCEAMS